MILEKVILGTASVLFAIFSAVGIKSISNPDLTVREYCTSNGRILIDNSSYRPISKLEIQELIEKTPEASWFSFDSNSDENKKQEKLITECKKLLDKRKGTTESDWDKSVERVEQYCSVDEE